MVLFEKTLRTAVEEALTRGNSLPFVKKTLVRIEKQEKEFLKPKFNYSILSLIPLAIITYLVLKK
jgi:hypothetical protein